MYLNNYLDSKFLFRKITSNIYPLLKLRFYITKIKLIIWLSFPTLVIYCNKKRRLRHNNIVLLIHEGLGDLAAMAACIKETSKEHDCVYIVANKNYFDAIAMIFDFGRNIYNIAAREGKFNDYRINKKRKFALKKYGYLIKVGYFNNDPIFRYPDTFYIRLGYSPSMGENKFSFDALKEQNIYLNKILDNLGGKFIFFSNETTTGALKTDKLLDIDSDFNIVTFGKIQNANTDKLIYDISKLNSDNFVISILNSLRVCYLAEYVILSDAGLFNILIRLKNNIDIRVIWRQHPHNLNKEIYGKYII